MQETDWGPHGPRTPPALRGCHLITGMQLCSQRACFIQDFLHNDGSGRNMRSKPKPETGWGGGRSQTKNKLMSPTGGNRLVLVRLTSAPDRSDFDSPRSSIRVSTRFCGALFTSTPSRWVGVRLTSKFYHNCNSGLWLYLLRPEGRNSTRFEK